MAYNRIKSQNFVSQFNTWLKVLFTESKCNTPIFLQYYFKVGSRSTMRLVTDRDNVGIVISATSLARLFYHYFGDTSPVRDGVARDYFIIILLTCHDLFRISLVSN